MKALTAARWVTLTVWAAVAATAVLWGLRLFAPGTPVPPHASTVAGAQALRGDPALLLGRDEEPAAAVVVPAAPARFKLLGVMVPKSSQAAGEGLALIAIDNRPARAYRVGAVVEGELVLQRVRVRGADLGALGGAQPAMALDAPAPPVPASTGSLPTPAFVRPPPPQPVLAPSLMPQLPGQLRNDVEGEPDDLPADERPLRPGLISQ